MSNFISTYSGDKLTTEAVAIIDATDTDQSALSRAGELGDAYHVQRAYIATKRDFRSVSQLPTKAHTRAKFLDVWREGQNAAE